MQGHSHGEHPWRVRVDVDRDDGAVRGAGVLLADGHVLTCAHVAGDEQAHVTVTSAACRPEWHATARVVPRSWVYKGGTREGDVALLKLDEPAPCDGHAALWCVPLSQGKVRAHGFPDVETGGIPVDAELGGDGGHEAQFGLLKVASPHGQWIEPGFSGAGVWVLEGEHAGHVIGIVVAEFNNEPAKAAWMMPTEVIRGYLPQVAGYVAGEPADRLSPSGTVLPDLASGDTVRVALSLELARLLTSEWTGTVVLAHGGSDTGTTWLARLVRTADPTTRAGTPGKALTAAPSGTVLGLGTVDAAYDAHGKSVAEVTRYLAERFGLPLDASDLPSRLARRRPPPCLVIAGVDQARAPAALIHDLVRPLAIRARSRGLRLVLGFDGPPPDNLPYDALLDPAPIPGKAGRLAAAEVEARAEELAAAEAEAVRLGEQDEHHIRKPPTLPPAVAPSLRVRLAAARDLGDGAELAGIAAAADAALDRIAEFRRRRERIHGRLAKLRGTLKANFVRQARHLSPEDAALGKLYVTAEMALMKAPIDLTAAEAAVDRYVAELDRRLGL
ncbi:MAG: trypsin-like serine protease [Trebonia sp.]